MSEVVYIENPDTGKKVKVGTQTYKRLIHQKPFLENSQKYIKVGKKYETLVTEGPKLQGPVKKPKKLVGHVPVEMPEVESAPKPKQLPKTLRAKKPIIVKAQPEVGAFPEIMREEEVKVYQEPAPAIHINAETEHDAFLEVNRKTEDINDAGIVPQQAEEPAIAGPAYPSYPEEEKGLEEGEYVIERGRISDIPPVEEEEGEYEGLEETRKLFSSAKEKVKEKMGEERKLSRAKNKVVTLTDEDQVVEKEPFIRVIDDNPEHLILETARFIKGIVEPIDQYEITIEMGEKYKDYVKTGNREKLNKDIKNISKKILTKELEYSRKKKEAKYKYGKILTKEDKIKFLQGI